MTRTLIRGGLVLSMDPETPYAIHSNILIDEGQIVAMGHNLEAAEAAEQIDASGMLVMPGLVNAHLHSWQTPLRGLAANWSLSDYMQKMLGQRDYNNRLVSQHADHCACKCCNGSLTRCGYPSSLSLWCHDE